MLKTYQFKTQCKGDIHSSKTPNIIFARTHDRIYIGERPYVYKRSTSNSVTRVVSTSSHGCI